jgi:predicted ATPase
MMKEVSQVQQLIVSTQSVELLNPLEPEHVVVAQMRRVVIVCEGQTQEAFISRLLFPAFVDAGLHLQGVTVEI